MVWAVEDGWDLDQYLFRDASPLNFAIDVGRDFGPVDAAGHPAPGNALHGTTGRITLRVYDVDDDAAVAPEVDEVYINGQLIGTLSGADGQWSINTFEFSLNHLLLPTATNPEGRNQFEVRIDTTNGGWAVQVDWAQLRLNEDFVPLGLIHGFTSSGVAMEPFKAFVDANSDLSGGEIITPTHSSTNLETSVQEISGPINDLLAQTGAHHLDIISHSMGGLISRLYAWDNPSAVDRLIMAGTPNGGASGADAACLFKNSNGPWAGPIWAVELFDDQVGDCKGPEDALYQLQTDYVQNVFNATVRDRNGTEYWTICGAWPEDERWFDLMDGADDGVVSLDSCQWLLMGRPDHPGKHRLLDTLPLEHGALIQEGSAAMPAAVCEFYGNSCAGASIQALETTETAELALGQTAAVEVAPGETATMDLNFEGASFASVMLLSDQLSSITPNLAGATFNQAPFFGATVLGAQIDAPVENTVQITNNGSTPARVLALVSVAGSRSLQVGLADASIDNGDTAQVDVTLTDPGAAETLSVEVVAPSGAVTSATPIQVSPGVWTADVTVAEAGLHTVMAWVDGERPRYDSTILNVATGSAAIAGTYSEALDGAAGGLADALAVTIDVSTPGGGYRLAGDLLAADGSVIASAGAASELPAGASALTLRFPGRAIFEAGVDGPFTIANVVLSRADAAMTIEDSVASLGTTAAYSHGQFDHFAIHIDEATFADQGVDSDGDGVFESLSVSFDAAVETAGTYAVNARLLAPDGTEVAEAQGTQSLAAGSNTLQLSFDAASIAEAGLDGPYTVTDLSVYPTSDASALGYLISAHVTSAYTAVQFGANPGPDEPPTLWALYSATRPEQCTGRLCPDILYMTRVTVSGEAADDRHPVHVRWRLFGVSKGKLVAITPWKDANADDGAFDEQTETFMATNSHEEVYKEYEVHLEATAGGQTTTVVQRFPLTYTSN